VAFSYAVFQRDPARHLIDNLKAKAVKSTVATAIPSPGFDLDL
jgi:hypothetical protein